MADPFRPAKGWGPGHQRAALSITFDNFGEAAQLEQGRFEGGELGKHHTAAFLPSLAELLGPVKATYFMEGINADVYPDQIRAWQAAGHEVALHGWRHEHWTNCPAERRVTLLADSMAAMRRIGVEPVGFRPPGGGMPLGAWTELAEAGMRYCSPAGTPGVGRVGTIVSLPFAWRSVDAFMIEPVLGFLREHLGEPNEPYSVAEWSTALARTLDELVADGGQRTIIFHPEFLDRAADKLDALREFIAAARQKDIWIAPAGEVAAFVADEMALPVLEAA